jgi:hypothetical protein
MSQEQTKTTSWVDYIPIISTLISMIRDWFEKTEEEELQALLNKYTKWHSNYIAHENGGRKRKNMLSFEAYTKITEPILARLKQIRDEKGA